MELIYNAHILVYKASGKGEIDEYGIYTPEPDKFMATLPAFVYPVSKDRVQKEFGITTDASYEVITDASPLLLKGTKIKYNNVMYEIEAIQDWTASILPCLHFLIRVVK